MDPTRLDALARTLSRAGSRRAGLRVLLGTLLGGPLLGSSLDALAAPGKAKGKGSGGDGTKQDRHPRNEATPKNRKKDHPTTPTRDPKDEQAPEPVETAAPERGETNDGQRRNGATGKNQPADPGKATRKAHSQDATDEPTPDPADAAPLESGKGGGDAHRIATDSCRGAGVRCRKGSQCCTGRCLRSGAKKKCSCDASSLCPAPANPCKEAACSSNGKCVVESKSDGTSCLDSKTCQDGQCVAVSCDDTICRFDHAHAFCQGETCTMGTCDAGWGNCNDQTTDGCETHFATDVNNCGRCNDRCSSTNATPSCVDGTCRVVCDVGFASCDGSAYSGCEVDTRTDIDHCGACNHACFFPNAERLCQDGTCVMGACSSNRPAEWFPLYKNCDGDPTTGCETDIFSDPAHCGECDQACPDGQVCWVGKCELPCGQGGPCRVFVTAATYFRGNMGGLAGADRECQFWAEKSALPGTYMAWLSDDTESPSTRFLLKSTAPYRTVDGVTIANDWTDLTDGGPAATIIVTETGYFRGLIPRVWTHTRPDGTAGGVGNAHCQNWTITSFVDTGDAGFSGASTSEWTEHSVTDCAAQKRLYCFQQSG